MEHRGPCIVQGHFGAIRCTCNLPKNTILNTLLLPHFMMVQPNSLRVFPVTVHAQIMS